MSVFRVTFPFKLGAFLTISVISIGFSNAQGRLLAIERSGILQQLNMSTGVATQIGALSGAGPTLNVTGATFDPITKTVYFAMNVGTERSLYRLNLETFAHTLIGSFGQTLLMSGLEFDPSTNKLYGMSNTLAGTTGFFEINKATGAATLIGSNAVHVGGEFSMGYVPSTNTLYTSSSGSDRLYTVNRANGQLTDIGPTLSPFLSAGAFNSDTNIMYMADSSTDKLHRINLATGNATEVGLMGPSTINITSMFYIPAETAPVPEPGTLAVLGLGAVAFFRRKRKK